MYYLLILYLLYFFGRAIRKFMASDERTTYFIMACAMACACDRTPFLKGPGPVEREIKLVSPKVLIMNLGQSGSTGSTAFS